MSALILLAVLGSTSAADSVVVFPDRAQVTRTATISCGARVQTTFDNVPPSAKQDSFRARISVGSVDGMRSELVRREKEYSPKAEQLKGQLEALEIKLGEVRDELARAQERAKLGNQYGEVAVSMVNRELAAEKPDLKSWQSAFDNALNSNLTAAKQIAEVSTRLRQLEVTREELKRQLDEVKLAQTKQSWTVDVLSSCPAGTSATLVLTYLVGGASWTPNYEARADEAGRTVELSTWATVRQGTGEDWKQAELVLSTAVPSQNATPPELKVLQLTAIEQAPEKKVLVRREEVVESAKVGASGPRGSPTPAVREQGLSVQLVVPERSTVAGDNTPVRVFVGKAKMKASFELRTMPKLAPIAFRVAELNNDGAWPLLPGVIDAFRKTGLVGRYDLERVPQGGAFTLTFGVEENVRVKRTIVDEVKRDTGLFNGNKRYTFAYRFEVANYAKAANEVTLREHLPVSELADIKVTIGEKTSTGYTLDPKDGIAVWKLSLRPGEKKTIDLAFQVDVPNTYDTGGI